MQALADVLASTISYEQQFTHPSRDIDHVLSYSKAVACDMAAKHAFHFHLLQQPALCAPWGPTLSLVCICPAFLSPMQVSCGFVACRVPGRWRTRSLQTPRPSSPGPLSISAARPRSTSRVSGLDSTCTRHVGRVCFPCSTSNSCRRLHTCLPPNFIVKHAHTVVWAFGRQLPFSATDMAKVGKGVAYTCIISIDRRISTDTCIYIVAEAGVPVSAMMCCRSHLHACLHQGPNLENW